MNELVHVPVARPPMDPRHQAASALQTFSTTGGLLAIVFASLWLVVGGSLGFAGLLAAIGVEVVLVVHLLRRRRRAVEVIRRSDDAVALLNQGRVDEAAAEFDRLLSDSVESPRIHVLMLYNRGVAEMYLGNVDEAIAILDAAVRSRWFKAWKPIYGGQAYQALAVAHVYAGRLDEARFMATAAHRELSEAKRLLMLPVDTMILAREGRFDESLALLVQYAAAAEGLLLPNSMRALRMLKAFLLSLSDPTAERHREMLELVRSAWPQRPLEYRAMAYTWPAFQQFLSTHGVPW
jgi:tetratricopeptide (TPR) repeat protein